MSRTKAVVVGVGSGDGLGAAAIRRTGGSATAYGVDATSSASLRTW
jgi:hypothetical protein